MVMGNSRESKTKIAHSSDLSSVINCGDELPFLYHLTHKPFAHSSLCDKVAIEKVETECGACWRVHWNVPT